MKSNGKERLSRILAYLALIMLPLVIVTAYNLPPPDEFAYNLGRAFALAAFVILILQFKSVRRQADICKQQKRTTN